MSIAIDSVFATLGNSIAFNVKIVGINENSEAFVRFELAGKTYTVYDYTKQNDHYVFTLKDIAPHLMTENVSITLSAKNQNGIIVTNNYTTSLKEYCLTVADQDESYRPLINAVLNYGAVAQLYKNYKTDNLANADLSSTEKVTPAMSYFDSLQKDYATVENPLAVWKSYGMYLDDALRLKLSFELETDVKNITLLVESDSGHRYELDDCFFYADGKYHVYFDKFSINEADEIFRFTLCKNGTPISDTVSYSAEAYAYRAAKTDDSSLKALIDALMFYCFEAKNY